VIFYKDKHGREPIAEMLKDLAEKAKTSKHARINKEKILTYIRALESYGTRIGAPVIKHIDGDIWELRPLDNRILFFYWKDDIRDVARLDTLLAVFDEQRRIEQAKRNLADFLESEG